MTADAYSFAYLDAQTKRMIRRAILEAVAVPGHQVPFASREMPMPCGWGTGGVQVTAACLTPGDRLKVVDRGADDTTDAVSIRRFFQRTAGAAVTEATRAATIIQTRHRIPETPLAEGQILVLRVPIPEPGETETRRMHALEECGLLHVKLDEDIARNGEIATAHADPVKVEGRDVTDPSPSPKLDTPKLGGCPARGEGGGMMPFTREIIPNTLESKENASPLSVKGLAKPSGGRVGCVDVGFQLCPGGVVFPTGAGPRDTLRMPGPERRRPMRTDCAFVHQSARDGLRLGVSAGGNVGVRLTAVGARHYGSTRAAATGRLGRVEIAADRIDGRPSAFSGGMRQRLQIAGRLVTAPRRLLMDEPTGGLDVSVQARLLDLVRRLVREMGLAAIIVTHDLAVVRRLADRLVVMRGGRVVGAGPTDRVLDDPQHACARLLVSSVPQVSAMIEISGLAETFTLHNQGGALRPVMAGAALRVAPGECVALTGRAGTGKSTLLRMVWGNYLPAGGTIRVGGLGVGRAAPREFIRLRRETPGHVSQVLRVVPRAPTVEVVAEPLLALGRDPAAAPARAEALLARLDIAARLWALSPTTFSGGEQRRANIAGGVAHADPALPLDEPTASLDRANREAVPAPSEEATARGAAILGIVHDEAARAGVRDRMVDMAAFAPEAAA